MSKKMLEISMLKNYGPSNLNRDEGGNPKDCIFGGALRGRISSQCLKRNIRKSEFFVNEISKELLGIRTVHMPTLVAEILNNKGYSESVAEIAASWLVTTGANDEKKSDREHESTEEKNAGLKTKQIMFFSLQEIELIADVLSKIIDEKGNDTKELKKVKEVSKLIDGKIKSLNIKPTSVDMAMFGRMITSNSYKNVEASVQVAHAISTNKLEREFDFFTAVDDLTTDEEMQSEGTDMLGDTGFNSNCYYMYCSIDLEELEKNLSALGEGAHNIVKKAVIGFVKAFAYSNPSGKQNSFAAHSIPGNVIASIKDKKIPINLADAFLTPVVSRYDRDLMQASVDKLSMHIDKVDKKYSETRPEKRLWFSLCDDVRKPELSEVCDSFDQLIKRLVEII